MFRCELHGWFSFYTWCPYCHPIVESTTSTTHSKPLKTNCQQCKEKEEEIEWLRLQIEILKKDSQNSDPF